MHRKALALLAVIAVFLTGCNPTAAPKVERGKRPAAIKSFVSLSPSTSEVGYMIDYGNRMKGRTLSCNFPPAIGRIPIVVRGTTPDYEAIAAAKPQIAMYDGTLYGPEVEEKLKSMNIEVIKYQPKNLNEYIDFLQMASDRFGLETTASEVADGIVRDVATMKAMVKSHGTAPKIAIMDPSTGTLAAGTKSFLGNLYKDLGFEVVGPDSDKWAEWSAESLVAANPGVILVTEGGLDKLKADPRFATVEAVKSGRIVQVKADVLLRIGSRVKDLVTSTVPRLLAGS